MSFRISRGIWQFRNAEGNFESKYKIATDGRLVETDTTGNEISTFGSSVAWTAVTGKPSTFTPSAHTHTIANVTGLQTALDGKQASGSYAVSNHNHTYNVNDQWLRDNGDNANVKLYGNSRQMVFRTDGTTEYATGVGPYAFAWMYGGDAASNRRMLLASDGRIWSSYHGWLDDAFQSKGSYAASSHTHAISDVTGLQGALDGKQAAGSYAAASHTHTIANVTGLQAALDDKQVRGSYLTSESDTLATVTSRGNTTNGSINVHGNILLTGPVTTTNQGRMIDFTGFDKEGTTDFSDRAYIAHTVNTGGHSGSVLVISSQNDSGDGIAFETNASSKLKHNSQNIATENWVSAQGYLTSLPSHTHTIANVTGLQTALDGKQAAGSYLTTSGKAADSNLLDGIDSSGFQRQIDESIVNIGSPNASSGTWTVADTDDWGTPRIGSIAARYNDGTGYLQFNVPAGMDSAYVSHLTWDSGGYVDCYGVQADGGLVFLRRINTRQSIENSNEGSNGGNPNQHDGTTISLVGTGLSTFSAVRLQNRVGRFHLTGMSFTSAKLQGTEGTGMVHPGQLSVSGSGSGLDADLLDGNHASAFAAASHTHSIANVTGLQAALDGKAASSHTHTIANVTGLQAALDGKQASGSYLTTSGKAADSNLLDGLDLHTGRNNEANKVVRTDANGYIQAGWINTTSGARTSSTAPVRITASNDEYLRYYSLEDFKVALGLPRSSYNRHIDYSATAGYHTGVMGHQNAYDVFNRLPHFGSGFIDFWSSAPNAPDSNHWVGVQSWHAVNWQGVAGRNYGWQLVHQGGTAGDIRFNSQWGDSDYGWIRIWNSANDGAGSGLDADLLDGNHASAFALASHTHAISQVTGLQAALDGKQASGSYASSDHGHTGLSSNGWGGLTSRTGSGSIDFGPANTSHAHIYTDRPNFYFNKTLLVNGTEVSYVGHTHTIANVTGLQAALDGKQAVGSYAAASHEHDRTFITDSRGAARIPGFYDDRYAQWDFQNSADTGAGGDSWHGLLTVAKWSVYHESHRQEQLAFTGNDLKRRTATSDSAWGAWKTILDSSNYSSFISTGDDRWKNTSPWSSGIYLDRDGLGQESSPFILDEYYSEIGNTIGAFGVRSRQNNTGTLYVSDGGQWNYGTYFALGYYNWGATSWQIAPMFQNGLQWDGSKTKVTLTAANSESRIEIDGEMHFYSNTWDYGVIFAAEFLSASDISLKQNISTITNPISIVKQLRGTRFHWKKDNRRDYGFIAQEVELVAPELVYDSSVGKSVSYSKTVAILTEAIKEQQTLIEQLMARLEALEAK